MRRRKNNWRFFVSSVAGATRKQTLGLNFSLARLIFHTITSFRDEENNTKKEKGEASGSHAVANRVWDYIWWARLNGASRVVTQSRVFSREATARLLRFLWLTFVPVISIFLAIFLP